MGRPLCFYGQSNGSEFGLGANPLVSVEFVCVRIRLSRLKRSLSGIEARVGHQLLEDTDLTDRTELNGGYVMEGEIIAFVAGWNDATLAPCFMRNQLRIRYIM
jgi:hypothetical protein